MLAAAADGDVCGVSSVVGGCRMGQAWGCGFSYRWDRENLHRTGAMKGDVRVDMQSAYRNEGTRKQIGRCVSRVNVGDT